MEPLGLKPALLWDAAVAGGSFTSLLQHELQVLLVLYSFSFLLLLL